MSEFWRERTICPIQDSTTCAYRGHPIPSHPLCAGLARLLLPAAGAVNYGDATPGAFLASIIHEAGHALCQLPEYAAAEPLDSGEQAAFLTRANAATAEYVHLSDEGERWAIAHEFIIHNPLDWLRLTLHLAHRSGLLGVPIPKRWLGVPEFLGHAFLYGALLQDECEAMTGASVSEILAQPAPTKYLEQVLSDAREFRRTYLPEQAAAA
jgi:hypothetical protein